VSLTDTFILCGGIEIVISRVVKLPSICIDTLTQHGESEF